jgi:hypothetical protein
MQLTSYLKLGCKGKDENLRIIISKKPLRIIMSIYFQSLNPNSFKAAELFLQFFLIFTHK